jgi:limonene-1,2-epoxide hydrolase
MEILADDFVREFGRGMGEFAGMESMECSIQRIAVAGDGVLTERVDSWSMLGVTLPIMGSFEVGDDGWVRSWTELRLHSP